MKGQFPLISIGLLAIGLIVGGLLGSFLFPQTRTVQLPCNGNYCYDTDYKQLYDNSVDDYQDAKSDMECYKDALYWCVSDLTRIKQELCYYALVPIDNSYKQNCYDAISDAQLSSKEEFNSCQGQQLS